MPIYDQDFSRVPISPTLRPLINDLKKASGSMIFVVAEGGGRLLSIGKDRRDLNNNSELLGIISDLLTERDGIVGSSYEDRQSEIAEIPLDQRSAGYLSSPVSFPLQIDGKDYLMELQNITPKAVELLKGTFINLIFV